jgi:hypothetical protein
MGRARVLQIGADFTFHRPPPAVGHILTQDLKFESLHFDGVMAKVNFDSLRYSWRKVMFLGFG